MKKQLRQGDVNALNVYTVSFYGQEGPELLGYSTFPSDYADDPTDDGVVLSENTLPGGQAYGYNLGKVSWQQSFFERQKGDCLGLDFDP